MITRYAGWLLLSLLWVSASPAANIQTVRVPFADVWNEELVVTSVTVPSALPADKRETQILFGEQVSVIKTRGPWALIEAIEQMEFTHHQRWQGYPGWVLRDAIAPSRSKIIGQDYVVIGSTWLPLAENSALAFGSHFKALPAGPGRISPTIRPEIFLSTSSAVLVRYLPQHGFKGREGILKAARTFISTPYLWGGLSPQGLDCSGLVHIAYRTMDRRVPRDAHDQWMMAQPIRRSQLKPGDVIFSAPADKPKKVTHVVIYAGADQIIEAPQTGMNVREIPFVEKFGKPLANVESGKTVGDRVLYFGTFFVPGS